MGDIHLGGAVGRERAGPGPGLEAEAARAGQHLLPDGAEAGDADALAEEAARRRVARLLPAAGAELDRGVDEAAIEREDEAEGQLGDGGAVLPGAVGHVDAVRAGRDDVDGVDPGAGAHDEVELLARVDGFRRDFGRSHDQDPHPFERVGSVSLVSSGRETISMPRTRSSSSAWVSILSASKRRIVEPTLPEKIAAAACLLVGFVGCSSDHHVSAWGATETPRLGAFMEAPDLDARLALVDTETAAHGLRLTQEIPVKLPHGGGPARIRGYEGVDALGRPVHAVRVATTRAVVMALGPLDSRDSARDIATELVPALLLEDGGRGGSAFQSGTDLTGDGAISVVARSETGQLAIWRVTSLGAAPYAVAIQVKATRGLDVDGDGRVDLAGDFPVDRGDPIAPRLSDAATFDGAGFSNRTEGARAFHAALARPRRRPRATRPRATRLACAAPWSAPGTRCSPASRATRR